MSEAAEATMSAARAAEVIARAAGYEEALRRRTEGAGWMIWGIVTAGVVLSYNAVAELAQPGDAAWYTFLWIPWVGAGALTTFAVWRIAAFNVPRIRVTARSHALLTGAWLLASGLAWGASWVATGGRIMPDTSALLALGTAWTLLGASGAFGTTRRGRAVAGGIGATLLVSGIVLAITQPDDWVAAERTATIVATLVGGFAPLLGGLWQSLRG